MWKGYFFKAVKTNKEFPSKYIEMSSYTSTPNQREEIKAYRDDNTRNLTRVTATGTKSLFAFATRKNLTLKEKMEIQKFFTDAEVSAKERKIELEYWNDEENIYKKGFFYRPNMPFKIIKADKNTIIYDTLQFDLIEY